MTVTWIGPGDPYDIRATLSRDGTIRFSYVEFSNVPAGMIVITSGSEPALESERLLASQLDPSGDVGTYDPPLPSWVAGATDITEVRLSRVADVDVLRLEVDVAGPIDRASFTSASYPRYYFIIHGLRLNPVVLIEVSFTAEHNTHSISPLTERTDTAQARIRDRTITIDFMQSALDPLGSNITIIARAQQVTPQMGRVIDSTTFAAVLSPPPARLGLVFSALQDADLATPLVEAFTLPLFDVKAVWEQVRSLYRLAEDTVDAVAIYQTFLTDIIFRGASAYAVGGNPGADGVGRGSASRPREPTLLHMNRMLPRSIWGKGELERTLLHEFGHRWLFNIAFHDGVRASKVLNPVTAHPAQYVDTRTAFRTLPNFTNQVSVMGGGWFADNGNGTFTTPVFQMDAGYTWLELYLMGLAGAGEVQPIFYIANSSPPLGLEYSAPNGITVRGVRTDVTIQQVIQGMGIRKPAYPATQRQFKILFVLVHTPDEIDLAGETGELRYQATVLERNFRAATGGRAEVLTTFAEPPPQPRRRAVRR